MKRIDNDDIIAPSDIIQQLKSETKQKHNGVLLKKDLLPSNGAFYPDDIYVTPFTGLDLKDITNITDENVNAVLYKILNRRIFGIDTSKILTNDKLWLIYYIRSITYKDNPIKMKCVCDKCESQSIQTYTIDKLSVKHYDKHLPDSQTKMPNDDLVEFTFPTIGSENQIMRLKNDPNLLEPIDEQIMLLASYIDTVNGRKLSLWDAYQYVKNCDAPTFCFIIHTLDEYSFGCDRTMEWTCDCGASNSSIVELSQEFFIPKMF